MNNPRRSSILTLLALATGFSTLFPAAAPVEIPFQLKGHLVVVKASIGNAGNLSMAVDTGATFSVISPAVAKKLGLKTRSKQIVAVGKRVTVKAAKVEILKVGELEFRHVQVRIGKLPRFKDGQVDGLIGLDVIRKTNWTFDFAGRRLIAGWTKTVDGCQSFYPGLAFIPIRLSIGGKTITMMLDTGTDKLLLFDEKVRKRVKMIQTRKVQNLHHVGGTTRMFTVLLSDVSFGDASWETREAHLVRASAEGYAGTSGILGPLALDLKQLHLDFQNSRVGVVN